MSEVFEGVVVSARTAELIHDQITSAGNLLLSTETVDPKAIVVFRTGPREQALFSEKMEELASQLSRFESSALLVRYDSRMGHRSSSLFVGGDQVQTFNEDDEEYVPLDDLGEPIVSARPVHISEFDPTQEYETIRNAIQLGLDALGFGHWDQLFKVITQQR
jgi:hypothetical protein